MAESCLGKLETVAKRPPGGTPEAPKNHLKTDPEIHLGPRGPIIWPKVPRSSHFTPQTSHFIDFCCHFASFLEGICDPKAANQASAEAENFSSILHISSRVRELCLFFKGRRQCFAHQYYYNIILLYYYHDHHQSSLIIINHHQSSSIIVNHH